MPVDLTSRLRPLFWLLTLALLGVAACKEEPKTTLNTEAAAFTREGNLFICPDEARHSFDLKNTLIPLAILFIRGDLSVANIARNAQPLDESGIPSAGPVRYVLEIKAGLSDRWGLMEGDRVAFERKP